MFHCFAQRRSPKCDPEQKRTSRKEGTNIDTRLALVWISGFYCAL